MMNEKKADLAFGFRVIDDQDALSRTHWLIFDPPEGYELDDHPPKGPDDQSYVQIFSQKDRDFLTDTRVEGCRHRIIRHDEWPDESRLVITRLWWAVERNAERERLHWRMKKKLQIILWISLVACVAVLMLLKASSLITLDEFNETFNVFGYVGAAIVGAQCVLGASKVCSNGS